MRSTIFRFIALMAVLLTLLNPACAYEADDAVGQPNMLLSAMSGDGSLYCGSTLGDACADAVALAADADFAIVCGGELVGNIQPKQCTYDDICQALLSPEQEIAVASVTAVQLRQILENGVSRITLDGSEAIDKAASPFSGFPQIGGFRLTYDASARPGQRVMHIKTNHGQLDTEDDQRLYTLAAPRDMLDGKWGYPKTEYELTGITLAEALAGFIASGTPDSYEAKDRITAVGCTDYNIVNSFPLVLCVATAIIIWLGSRLWKYKYPEK